MPGLTRGYAATDPVIRFWRKVDRSGDCWIWTAHRDRKGYGLFGVASGKTVIAHRFAWELEFGPILDGLFICHTCNNPACVRPGHLFMGTHADNMKHMMDCGRSTRGERDSQAKLNGLQVHEIRSMIAAGEIQARVAERFGISTACVSLIKKRKRWPHV